jgi:uncharacterized protein YdhG (YjbR/CyaY superfamily)
MMSSTKKKAAFSAEERAAMRARAKERKGANDESTLLERVAEMSEADRAMATRVHEIVKAAAPELEPRTWYGMPAYAKDGSVVCFFKSADKFKSRYATLGFSDKANLDDGSMWPTDFALKKLTGPVEKEIAALVKRAVS